MISRINYLLLVIQIIILLIIYLRINVDDSVTLTEIENGYATYIKCDVDDTIWIDESLVWRNRECGGYEYKLDRLNEKSILLLGDSLTRRFGYTLHTLLTKQNLTRKDINYDFVKHGTIEYTKKLVFNWTPCFKDVATRLKSLHKENVRFNFIVISIGSHFFKCKEDWISHFDSIVYHSQLLKDSIVFFRTEPLPDEKPDRLKVFKSVNNYVKTQWEKRKDTLIDHQRLMYGRDLGVNRIHGNSNYHYGPSARLALVQHFYKFLIVKGFV